MTLQAFFAEYPKAAIAFSGGVDSSYLLYAAKQYAKDVCAYYVKSEFQPLFELEDARRLASELKVRLKITELSVLTDEKITENSGDRCYHCKKRILAAPNDSTGETRRLVAKYPMRSATKLAPRRYRGKHSVFFTSGQERFDAFQKDLSRNYGIFGFFRKFLDFHYRAAKRRGGEKLNAPLDKITSFCQIL
ncbi:MAG: 7-cyano-7-deazaguanine synthase [Oscillospiraceae bacterium]|nr:7-cyano-7-deazaguanine synthase [Oscillospiraceae bacterium]